MNILRRFTLLLFLLTTLMPASAQEEPTTAPVTPVEPVPPVEPEAQAPDEIIGTLVLSDDSALQVLDLLEQMTGKIILRRQDISPAKINFNSRGPIKKSEAVLALESLLTLNSIMLTDMGGRFMKAVPATDVNRHVPEMLYGSCLDLPASQQIYAKLFQFQYLNAEQASGTIINPLLSQNSGFIAFPKSNALLITDALINLQRIERIIAEADRPQTVREEIKFIKLNYVQAKEMQERLENLIEGPLKSYLEGNTSVTADERTNQLILITPKGNLDTIMGVIASVDVDAAPLTGSEVFQLRQAKAEEVVPIIENIIKGQEAGREEDAKVARDNKTANKGTEGSPPVPVPGAVQSAGATTVEANSSLQFSSFVGLSADERTNSIVAYGTQQDLKTLKELIDKIDIPLPQVRIEVIITEVSLTNKQASGLSTFNAIFDEETGLTPDTTGPISFALDKLAAPSAQFGNFSLNAVLDLAETDSDIKILSTPTIIVSHNEEGLINVSESRPIQTSSTTYTNTGGEPTTQDQVEYRDVGIKLTVTPLIGADGSVTMNIEQTVDTVRTQDDPNSTEVNTRPIIGKREANSTITVSDGQVIILGGLQSNTKDSTKTYFPLIGRLPILKDVLSGDKIEYTRTELIIFVRPTILRTPTASSVMTNAKLNVIKGGPAVTDYLENGTTGDIYMDGSGLEEEEDKAPVEQDTTTPRSLKRH